MAGTEAVNGPSPSWILNPRLLLLSWSAFLVAAILAAPLMAAAGRLEGWVLYSALDPLCHQLESRTWRLHGMPLAVCVRCFGVYAGILMAAGCNLRLPVKALALAFGLAAGAWAVEFLNVAVPAAEIRFATGLALGAAMCGVVLSSLSES